MKPVATDMNSSAVTRFAPSPTGHLHIGNTYSALFAEREAAGGRFLLRIEDIDPVRCHPAFTDAILEDLAWLGLTWESPVRCQSEHMADYQDALANLEAKGLLYPCFCTRADIRREIEDAGYAPHEIPSGPDGPVYPGTCRDLSADERQSRIAGGESYARRLDMSAASATARSLTWHDLDHGEINATPEIFGDVVLARKDVPTSYHLAVTLDDHLQGVTLVTRGEDLLPDSHLHRLLQALLDLDVPKWRHHPLLTDDDGKRFAKRDKAATLRDMRAAGRAPENIRQELGFT